MNYEDSGSVKEGQGINELLKQAPRQNIILRSPDGDEFVLAELDDFDREIELTRQNKKLMELLDRRGKQKQTVPLAEAKARPGLE